MSIEEIKAIINDSGRLDEICKSALASVDTENTGYIDEFEMGTVINSVLGEIGFYEIPQVVDNALSEFKVEQGKVSFDQVKEFIRKALQDYSNSEK